MKYKIIYADPPWTYRDKAHSGRRGVQYKYGTLELLELSRLPIKDISDEDCALFLWATLPLLPHAILLIESWGFSYKTVAFVWIKTNKRDTETLFWGMGNWTRANAELCLLATRGKPVRQSASVHQVIVAPVGEHSSKPIEVADSIVELMGDISRIELFARRKLDGWHVWGNEVESDIQLCL